MAETSIQYEGSPEKKKKKKKKKKEEEEEKEEKEKEEEEKEEKEENKMLFDWDEHFMAMALSMRCVKCCRQVGACIVDDNKSIISIGYNEISRGYSEDEVWVKNPTDQTSDHRGFYVYHAELNVIIDAMKTPIDLTNCTMYVTLFPCNECAKLIIRSGIKTVIYISDKYSEIPRTKAARKMLNSAGVTLRQHVSRITHICEFTNSLREIV